MFPNDEKTREWLEKQMWPKGTHCPHCGSFNVQCNIKHKTMTHRFRDCSNRPQFSLKTGSVMQASNLGYRDWAIAINLLTTNLKGLSEMKLHRELEIAYTSSWHLVHRLRAVFEDGQMPMMQVPCEIDEVYLGGKRKNMPKSKRKELSGRGPVGKNRYTNKVVARKVENTDRKTLHGIVDGATVGIAQVYSDEAAAHTGMDREHDSVNHSAREYVRVMAHTNGIEAYWSMIKHDYTGTFQHFRANHMDRHITEFAGRHNIRDVDLEDQMEVVVRQSKGKRVLYRELVA